MKKIVSVLLCLVMMMSLCTVAFAAPATPCGTDCWGNKQVPHSATTHDNVCSKCGYVWSTTECVFDQGNPCICGNTKPVATEHDCWKNLGYENLKDGNHRVYCTKCEKTLTESTPCVWEDGTTCVCGSEEPACKHEGAQKLVDNKDGKTHNAYCPTCNELMSENIPHSYLYKGTVYVGEGGTTCLCGAKKPACKHEGAQKLVDNKDGKTHNAYCPTCNELMSENIPHSYLYNGTVYVGEGGTTCLCGAKKPADCDHMGNHWIYTPVDDTHHSVTCKDCGTVVTESAVCVFETGKCVCGNTCKHTSYIYKVSEDGKTHEGYCADCGKHIATEDGEHELTYVNNKDGKNGTHNATCDKCGALVVDHEKHVFKGNKCTLCNAKKSAPSGGSTTGTTTATTKSPKTGDMGVVLYAATALLSLSGTAVVIKKRKNDK